MTTKIGRRNKPDPLSGPIADQATAVPASDRLTTSRDNLPKLSADAVASFKDELLQRDGFDERVDALEGAAGRAIANDEETAGRCADLQRQIAAAAKHVEDTRKSVKEPYFEAGRAVDTAAKAYSNRLTDALNKVRRVLEDHLRHEEQKRRAAEEQRRREEAARLAAEEERRRAAAAANEPEPEPIYEPEPMPMRAPEPVRARGDYGSTATGVKVWKSEVENYDQAFKAVKGNANVREAIDKAIQQRVKAGDREIKGVRIFEDMSVRVR